MTDAAFDALIDATFGKAEVASTKRVRKTQHRRRFRLHWLFADADTQAGIRNTAWAGYAAVAEYVDHYAPVGAKGDEAAARAARVLTSDDPNRIKRPAWTALAPARASRFGHRHPGSFTRRRSSISAVIRTPEAAPGSLREPPAPDLLFLS